MMIRAMLFVDGTWLYVNTPRLGEACGRSDFRLDFGKLPQVLAEQVGERLGCGPVDVVRTHLFGSYATNHDLVDDDAVQRRREFFDMLRESYHYEVETFAINFAGRRLRRAERDPQDTFEPREQCVDVALAASLLYYAAIPDAYDVAIVVAGDGDFKPALCNARRLGKRVAVASIRGSCSPELSDPRDRAQVRDCDVIWLNDLVEELALRYERHQLACESPIHKGPREVWTTFHPRRGQRFFCDDCRREFSRQREEAQREFVGAAAHAEGESYSGAAVGVLLSGMVKRKIADRGFAFIEASDGQDYFFHLTDLEEDLSFDQVYEGLPVDFEVKTPPSLDKAGAAQNVRRRE
jgi:cold shock CspA family protein